VKTSFHKLFLFLLFRSRNFRNHIIQSAKGSTIVMITQDAFLYTNIIIPDQETLNQFDLVIKPLFNKIRANSEQIQSLSATRDQLLPKLMSGEVRVEF
jgi:restriction modification system DNA specificity domain protein